MCGHDERISLRAWMNSMRNMNRLLQIFFKIAWNSAETKNLLKSYCLGVHPCDLSQVFSYVLWDFCWTFVETQKKIIKFDSVETFDMTKPTIIPSLLAFFILEEYRVLSLPLFNDHRHGLFILAKHGYRGVSGSAFYIFFAPQLVIRFSSSRLRIRKASLDYVSFFPPKKEETERENLNLNFHRNVGSGAKLISFPFGFVMCN